LVVIVILGILMVIPFVAIQLGELVSVFVDRIVALQQTIVHIGWSQYIHDATFLP